MIKNVVSKGGIYFVNPDVLIKGVKLLEEHHPGWWWSLSQRIGELSVSMGPGRNGPHEKDLKLALTREGDNGYHYTLHSYNHSEEEFLVWLNTVFLSISPDRNKDTFAIEPPLASLPAKGDWYRRQDDRMLDYLSQQYETLLSELSLIEDKGYILHEVYIGACDTTADCSLRGKRPNDSDFDVSVDIPNRDAGIGNSFYWSLTELKDDILTHR